MYYVYIVSKEGISPDPTKMVAIKAMDLPINITELIGMVNPRIT